MGLVILVGRRFFFLKRSQISVRRDGCELLGSALPPNYAFSCTLLFNVSYTAHSESYPDSTVETTLLSQLSIREASLESQSFEATAAEGPDHPSSLMNS